jgi:hypothetical protein
LALGKLDIAGRTILSALHDVLDSRRVRTRVQIEASWKSSTWESGMSGIVLQVPERMRLNAESAERLLAGILGVGAWQRVRGPDSMQLRKSLREPGS